MEWWKVVWVSDVKRNELNVIEMLEVDWEGDKILVYGSVF